MTVSMDFETRSTVDLRRTGVYKYAQDKTTDVWCLAYAFDDNEPQIWTPGMELDENLVEYIKQNVGDLRAWNANFERIIWNEILVTRYGWPKTTISQWVCTASEARAMALPGSLDMAARVLGVQEQKDKEGSNLMLRMARPRSYAEDGTPIWWDIPERVNRLVQYCLQDVRTEVAIGAAIRRLGQTETKVFNLDQTINDRGVKLDVKLAKAAKKLAEKATLEANRLIYDVTNGKVQKVSSVAQLTKWLKEQGLEVDGLGKDKIKDLQSMATGPALEALAIRADGGKSSVAKVESMLEAVCKDGRIRGLLLYHGAATGRWAGRLVQPQNFPRGEIKKIEDYIPLVYAKDFDGIEAQAPVLAVISSMLRSMLISEDGHNLLAADFNAIEARVLAWLADEALILETFRQGKDAYKVMASKIYNVPAEEIGDEDPRRQLGKTAILGLGYGMGAQKFVESCAKVGIEIDIEEAKTVVKIYRESNQKIVRYWSALNRAAIDATKKPGSVQEVGCVKYTQRGGYLWCVLPSKRPLAYAKPKVVERITPWGSTSEAVSFEGMDSFTKKWERHDLYGGLLAENVTQAVARDIMAHGMLNLEERGYPIVCSVHDEVIAEIPEGFGSVAEFEAIMCEVPTWASDCPIKAKGWIGKRYRK